MTTRQVLSSIFLLSFPFARIEKAFVSGVREIAANRLLIEVGFSRCYWQPLTHTGLASVREAGSATVHRATEPAE